MAVVSTINILIVDDHELVRVALRHMIESEPEMNVSGEAVDGEEALLLFQNLTLHVVLLDVTLPGIGGLEAMKRMLDINPKLKILALGVSYDGFCPARFLHAGAAGYITKYSSKKDLLLAIRTAASGERYISPNVIQRMAIKKIDRSVYSPFDMLSNRELQVANMVLEEWKVKEIAAKLNLSPKTVNSYRYRIFSKLKIKSDVGLAHLAHNFKIEAV